MCMFLSLGSMISISSMILNDVTASQVQVLNGAAEPHS